MPSYLEGLKPLITKSYHCDAKLPVILLTLCLLPLWCQVTCNIVNLMSTATVMPSYRVFETPYYQVLPLWSQVTCNIHNLMSTATVIPSYLECLKPLITKSYHSDAKLPVIFLTLCLLPLWCQVTWSVWNPLSPNPTTVMTSPIQTRPRPMYSNRFCSA
jgi:hypothetical protein